MTSYGKIVRVKRTKEPVPLYQSLILRAENDKMSLPFALSLAAETTMFPCYALPDSEDDSFMTKTHADFACAYAVTADKSLKPIDMDPADMYEEDDWEPEPPQKLPGTSGSAPFIQIFGHSNSAKLEPKQHRRSNHSKHSKHRPKDENTEPVDYDGVPWPQIKHFITSKRDFDWFSVHRLVTLSPEEFSAREKDFRVQATHLVYSWQKKVFYFVWAELKLEQDLDLVLKSVDTMIPAVEASTARGYMDKLHEELPADIRRACEALMRGTFFRNDGTIVFHMRLFLNYLNEDPNEVDKME